MFFRIDVTFSQEQKMENYFIFIACLNSLRNIFFIRFFFQSFCTIYSFDGTEIFADAAMNNRKTVLSPSH